MTAVPVVVVPPGHLSRALHDRFSERITVLEWDGEAPFPAPRAELVVLPYLKERTSVSSLSSGDVGIVQTQTLGVDDVPPLLPEGTTLCNARGVHEASTAEMALTLILASQRRLDTLLAQRGERAWVREFTPSLADRKVLLLGYGGVGQAVAARLAPFEVELTVVASRAREVEGVQLRGIDELTILLPEAEILVITLPGGPKTHHLIDAGALDLLPHGALVVNVGRGTIVDQSALVARLGDRRLRAGLDVTEPEPLPSEDPLWEAPGLVLSPHVGGLTSAMDSRVARLTADQVARLLDGDSPLHVVAGPA